MNGEIASLILAYWKNQAWHEMYLIFTKTSDCGNISDQLRLGQPAAQWFLTNWHSHGHLMWCHCFSICYILPSQYIFRKYIYFKIIDKVPLRGGCCPRVVVWRPLAYSMVRSNKRVTNAPQKQRRDELYNHVCHSPWAEAMRLAPMIYRQMQ